MSKALKQIEENLNIMKTRAIKAEKENKKLKQQLNSMSIDGIKQEREAIREKTKTYNPNFRTNSKRVWGKFNEFGEEL